MADKTNLEEQGFTRERERERDADALIIKHSPRQNWSNARETRDSSLATKGIPLGNLTSQFFANVYLNELDQFVKHKIKARYYIRYVDDFILLSSSKSQLQNWKNEISYFLKERLELKLHPDKSKIINLSKGIDFVGFRNFYYCNLLRKRNINKIKRKIEMFNQKKISYEELFQSFQGWNAYADWADSHRLVEGLIKKIRIE